MKHIKIYTLWLMLLATVTATAQENNKFYVGDVSGMLSLPVDLPFYVENTSDGIVALQADVYMPEGMTLRTSESYVTYDKIRLADHRVSVTSLNTSEYGPRAYRVMMLSATNRPVSANRGMLFAVQATIAADAPMTTGQSYPIEVRNVVLSDVNGDNLVTEYDGGSVTIAPSPDFTISNPRIVAVEGGSEVSNIDPYTDITCSWTVNNVGSANSLGGWNVQMMLVSTTTGETVTMGTSRHIDEILDASTSRDYTGLFSVPRIPGMDGQVKLQLVLVPGSESGEKAEYQQNNTTQSATTYSLSKRLYLTAHNPEFTERGNGKQGFVAFTLERSGSRKEAMDFDISAVIPAGETRMSLSPTTANVSSTTAHINSGGYSYYFYMYVNDDDLLNGDVVDYQVNVAAANGYAAVSADAKVIDDEHPKLDVTLSSEDLHEGDQLILTVTSADGVPASDVKVQLLSDFAERFVMPSSVTLPAGQTSVSTTVKVVDDNDVSDDIRVTFTAVADGYNKGEVKANLYDDDMPQLTLELSPSTVSEGAGANAVQVILRRDAEHVLSNLTIEAKTDNDDILYSPMHIFNMPRGTQEVKFSLTTLDNALVDGDHEVKLTVAIYYPRCGCQGQKEGSKLEKTITVVDDDGPALTLIPKNPNMLEGTDQNEFILQRNVDPVDDLVVNIGTVGNATGLTFPSTVTIPQGATQTTFMVGVARNDVSNDSQTITFKATAQGFSRGTCWVQTTDQTLPDATIALSVESEKVYATIPARLKATIHNYGYAPLPAKTSCIIVAGNNTVYEFQTTEPLEAGGVSEMSIEIMTSLSDHPGEIGVYAYVNNNGAKQEVNYSNNSSEVVKVKVLSLLRVTEIASDRGDNGMYSSLEPITISGKTTGMVNREADLEVYMIQGGSRLTLNTKTDEEGNFSVVWNPALGMAGIFEIGACMPGENLHDNMNTVQLYGMRRATGNFLTHEFEVGETVTGYMDIINPGNLPLSGIKATLQNAPDNVEFHINNISGLAAGETRRMEYTIKGLAPSESVEEWQELNLRLESNEHALMLQTIYFGVFPAVPVIKANISDINTTMIKDDVRNYEFKIRNEGRKETGEITIDFGDMQWITTATPQRMASLATGEEATVVLQMRPTADMGLNSITRGIMGIIAANGGGLSLPLRVECVSEKTGNLTVDVWDEFTANPAEGESEGPHVAGATVAILHPVTQELLHQEVTDASGMVTFEDLAEGNYLLKVTHPKHESYLEYVLVSPGRTLKQRAFINYSAITIEMTYEPTEIEDVYNISTTLTYETNVPAPVVKMDMPKEILLDEIQTPYIFYATLTNVGLITAKDSRFEIDRENGPYRFTPLIEGPWNILPQQSVMIPVEITKVTDGSAEARGAWNAQQRSFKDDAIDCALSAVAKYRGSCELLGGSAEYQAKQLMKTSNGCTNIADIADNLTKALGNLGFGGRSTGPWVHPVGSGGRGTVGAGVTGVPCDNCLYKNAPKYMSAAAGMGGGKKGAAKGAATLLRPCDPDGNLKGFFSRAQSAPRKAGETLYDYDVDNMSTLKLLTLYHEIVAELKDADDPEPITVPALYYENDAKIEIPAWQPNYLKAWTLNSMVAHDMNYHELVYCYLVVGDSELPEIETTEALNLMSAARKGIGTLTDAEKAALHPAALNDEQYAAVLQRLAGISEADKELASQLESRMRLTQKKINRKGYADAKSLFIDEANTAVEFLNDNSRSSVCATVKLQLNQQMTMTRQAVRGTLTVVNGSESEPMTNVRLNLRVTDPDGNIATAHIMEIHTESLEGFTGELDYESGWSLGAKQTGVATIMFIPTKYAAPDVPLQYTFAGTISFTDPFSGREMTRELETERLTVSPCPELDLTYFMQRDILGDDPLTDEVEPIVPAQFTLLINNKGNGNATKVKMVTNQPEIIENERGLLAEFTIESSQLNGGDKTLALGKSVATDFGDIPAHSQAYAQWWMTSRFTGHFTDYHVEATHVTSFDNPDLSLLDNVTIHELIHQIKMPDGDSQNPPLIGFMVNDEEDSHDTPDIIYVSDGTTLPIYKAMSATATKRSETEYTLEVTTSAAGWNYGYLPDPTGGTRKLLSVRRGDGTVLPTINFWQTDRTLRDSFQPVYENLLHFCDDMALTNVTNVQYILTFEDRPATILAVQSISGLPNPNDFTRTPVGEVVVTFNKPINKATFTTDDMTMMHEGVTVDLSGIEISDPLDNDGRTYKFDLSGLTTLDGYYNLSVQTAEINDLQGYHGEEGKISGWIQLTDGQCNLTVKVSPVGAGTVTPTTAKHDFYSDIDMTATANEGYTFARWTKNDEPISDVPNFTYAMAGPATLTAEFRPQQRNIVVNIVDVDGRTVEHSGNGDGNEAQVMGTIECGTGVYDYNSQITMKATPKTGYYFYGWKHGDELLSEDEELTITVTKDDTYQAVFGSLVFVEAVLSELSNDNVSVFANPKGEYYRVTMDRKLTKDQWNTFCVPFDISEQQINKTWGYATSLAVLKSVETDGTMNFEYAWNIKAGIPYLIKPERTVENPVLEYKGNLRLEPLPIPTVIGDYTYVGNYSPYTWTADGAEWYFGVKTSQLIKVKQSLAGSNLNGFRGYFLLPNGASARLSIYGVVTTGIDEVDAQQSALGSRLSRIYNLQGVYMGDDLNRLPAGMYIVNGKKTVKQ